MPSAIANSGKPRRVGGRVLADEERGRAPARHLDREVVGERARPQRLVGEIRASALKLSITTRSGSISSTRSATIASAASGSWARSVEPRSTMRIRSSSSRGSKNRNPCMCRTSFSDGSESVVKYSERFPWRAAWNSIWSARTVLPEPGSPDDDRDRLRRDAAAQDLVEPRHAGAHALEPERLAFTAHRFASSPARPASTSSGACASRRAITRAGELAEQRVEIVAHQPPQVLDGVAPLGVVPRGGEHPRVLEPLAPQDERGELRLLRRRTLQRSPQQRGGRRRADEVRHLVPEPLEQLGGRGAAARRRLSARGRHVQALRVRLAV